MNARTQILNEILVLLLIYGGKMKYADLFSLIVDKHGTTEKTFWDCLTDLKVLGKIDYKEVYTALQGPGEMIISLK
jgi:hypothetical protein